MFKKIKKMGFVSSLFLAVFILCAINQASATDYTTWVNGACGARGHGCLEKGIIKKEGGLLVEGASYTKEGGLTMTFNKSVMSDLDKKDFTKSNFTVDNDVILNDDVSKSFGAPKGYVIKKGNYKITKDGDLYRVNYSISQPGIK